MGSPSTITVLAVLVSLGLTLALVGSLRQLSTRAADARRSEALAVIADASIDLLAALQLERGRAQLFVTTQAVEDADRYRSTFVLTDTLTVAQAEAFEEARALMADSEFAAAGDDMLNAVRSVTAIRDEVLAGNVEDNESLYAGAIDPLLQRFADQSFAARNVDQVRLRRAVLSLLAASDALGRRRALVIGLVASAAVPSRDETIQLSILQRDYLAGVGQASVLTTGIERDGIDLGTEISLLPQSTTTATVDTIIESLLARGEGETSLPDGAATPQEWFETASVQFRDVIVAAGELNNEVHRRATVAVATAERDHQRAAILFTSLLLLSMVAGASSIVASRERVMALAEHRELVDGLREWFLPATFPDIPGVELEARYVPAATHADAGGDWYDVFQDGMGQLHVVMGDVAGHTARMVAHVAELRNIIRGVSHASPGGPARILETVDATSRVGQMTTVFLAKIALGARVVSYSRAGHVPAVLRTADGAVELLDEGTDVPLGVDTAAIRSEHSRPFGPGDTLVLFTDGLIDGPEAFLPDELENVAKIVAEVATGDLGVLADRLQGIRTEFSDDRSLLILHRTVAGATHVDASDESVPG